MSKRQQAENSDGRRQRSERSRRAIIDAALALIAEGVLIPSAQQISDCANVGIRTFFRHFADMETLFDAVDQQIRDSTVARYSGGEREGTLAERILHAAQRHADNYETDSNTMLSTAAQMWRYESLRKRYARYQRGLRRDLDDWLPELKALPASRRHMVDAIASFEMWHRLRAHQGLSKAAATNVVVELLTELVPG